MRFIIEDTNEHAGQWTARYIVNRILEHQAKTDKPFVLGLPTGSTPLSTYKELINLYKEGKVSFKNVITFNMDEYVDLPEEHPESYHSFMWNNFFNHVDINPENVFVPKLTEAKEAAEVSEFCADYDAKARNLDLLVMGMGEKGQIGFNEAGASDKSRTRTVLLPYSSRKRESKNFANIAETPDKAIAMGISTMLSAKKIYLSGNLFSSSLLNGLKKITQACGPDVE